MPRAKELRALPAADLAAQLEKLRQEIWQSRIKTRDGSSQQTHQVLTLKRQIARLHTILHEQDAAGKR